VGATTQRRSEDRDRKVAVFCFITCSAYLPWLGPQLPSESYRERVSVEFNAIRPTMGNMSTAGSERLPSVFIGSSTEGLDIARHLQSDLESTGRCIVSRWDQGIFEPSSYTIPQLAHAASEADFAVLIATADDILQSRGVQRAVARDNVYFELGLFIGALGLSRTYIMAAAPNLHLPSDLQGLTYLPYRDRDDKNIRAAVNDATIQITARVAKHGPRNRVADGSLAGSAGSRHALSEEIAQICSDAKAQGWLIKSNSSTVLRLRSPRGRNFTLPLAESARSREDLRLFAAQLRANGLRVSQSVRRPMAESPIQV
jgi:predicted nucleotide-binding protein